MKRRTTAGNVAHQDRETAARRTASATWPSCARRCSARRARSRRSTSTTSAARRSSSASASCPSTTRRAPSARCSSATPTASSRARGAARAGRDRLGRRHQDPRAAARDGAPATPRSATSRSTSTSPCSSASPPSSRGEFPGLFVHGIGADFDHSLDRLPPGDGTRLIAFLGSTIGNLRPADQAPELMRSIRRQMRSGDHFLLGVDLIKDRARLEAAYNDSRGVTAAFSRNIWNVVNRLADADFDPDAFRHRAFWDEENAWMDIRQVVRARAARPPARARPRARPLRPARRSAPRSAPSTTASAHRRAAARGRLRAGRVDHRRREPVRARARRVQSTDSRRFFAELERSLTRRSTQRRSGSCRG